MTMKASGHSALILATGLCLCFAGPQAAAGTDEGAKSESVAGAPIALNKYAKHGSRHSKTAAQRKSDDVALKSSDDKKAAATDIATEDSVNSTAIPPRVANAHAQLVSADTPAGSARAMSARANEMLQAAPASPADAQPAAGTQFVAADQLNEVDRALHESQPPAAAMAIAPTAAPLAAPVMASSNESSTWDQASLIGKIFIAFGGLLTLASAARMFMA
jgi:hypothetical protein